MKEPRCQFLAFSLLFFLIVSSLYSAKAQENTTRPDKAVLDEDQFALQQRESREKNPPGLTFTLRLKNNQKQFRQGEVIQMGFGFSSTKLKSYSLNTASYDRSGRLHMDGLHLTPEVNTSDPMADYFDNTLGFMMGGLFGFAELKEEPHWLTFELNEWMRFDKPGKYRLYVTSPRVGRYFKSPFSESKNTSNASNRIEIEAIEKDTNVKVPTVTSNLVEFEIVEADPEWQAKELQRTLQMLTPRKGNENLRDTEDKQRLGRRILRFLDSKAALQEIMQRLGNESENTADYYFGLFGSTQREFVIEEMEKRIDDPSQAISSDYLNALARLTVSQQFPNRTLKNSKSFDEYFALFKPIRTRYMQRLASAILQKTGQAKAISLNTFLSEGNDPAIIQKTAAELPKVFLDLPDNKQRDLLSHQWEKIANPAMLPILRKLYALPAAKSQTPEDHERREVRNLALRRLYELAPQEGRELILKALKMPTRADISEQVLGLLPDKVLPELDQQLVALLEKDDNTARISALIARYASGDIYPRVREFYGDQGGKSACALQSSLLAYFLRVDPAEGATLIRQAIKTRQHTRCYRMVLQDVAKFHPAAELENIAKEFLNDPEPEVMKDAIDCLSEYGAASAENALWQRLEKMRHEPENSSLEQNLTKAILEASSWLMDASKLQKLKELCKSKESREEIAQAERALQGEIKIHCWKSSSDWNTFEVAHYKLKSFAALKEKLSQFPKGTVFKWQSYSTEMSQQETKWFAEIKEFLQSKEMIIKN